MLSEERLTEYHLSRIRKLWGNEDHYYSDAEVRGAENGVQELLAEHDRLAAEVARLMPDAKLGAAVRSLPIHHYVMHGQVLQWYVDSQHYATTQFGYGDTPDAALADAGLMEASDAE